jgi:hypothetical protein
VIYLQALTLTPNPSLGLRKTVYQWGVIRGAVDTGAVFPEHESAVAFAELLNDMAKVVQDAVRGDLNDIDGIASSNLKRNLLGRRVQLALADFLPFTAALKGDGPVAQLVIAANTFNGHPGLMSGLRAMRGYLYGKTN